MTKKRSHRQEQFIWNKIFNHWNIYLPEAARKLVVVEAELERAENRIDQLSLENSRYADEVRTLSNDLKSFEASDEQFADRESQVFFSKFIIFRRSWLNYFNLRIRLFIFLRWKQE